MALYELRGLALERGGRRVLALPALDIDRHTVTALLGPNGVGKSTLLETLACLRLPACGELRYDGSLLTVQTAAMLARRVGLVAQQPYLFDRSVRANAALGLRLRGVSRQEAARRADAVLERLAISTLAARSARELSGGEAQKVALARTLALAPEVLLLDEPFSFLDVASVAELQALIVDYRSLGVHAVVFATHDEALAYVLADVVLRLGDGGSESLAPLNFLRGTLDARDHCFRTGAVVVHVAEHVGAGTRIAIDPAHVVLSGARLDSSMRNALEGRVVGLIEHRGEVLVTLDVGVQLRALVTHEAVAALSLAPGSRVWASFKSNAVRVF